MGERGIERARAEGIVDELFFARAIWLDQCDLYAPFPRIEITVSVVGRSRLIYLMVGHGHRYSYP